MGGVLGFVGNSENLGKGGHAVLSLPLSCTGRGSFSSPRDGSLESGQAETGEEKSMFDMEEIDDDIWSYLPNNLRDLLMISGFFT